MIRVFFLISFSKKELVFFSLYRPYLGFTLALCRAPVCVVASPLKQELSIALNMGLYLALDFMMTSKIFKVK